MQNIKPGSCEQFKRSVCLDPIKIEPQFLAPEEDALFTQVWSIKASKEMHKQTAMFALFIEFVLKLQREIDSGYSGFPLSLKILLTLA